jgi:hypothetical protein
MARLKKYGETLNIPLTSYNAFITDSDLPSVYMLISEFKDTLTGGKNGFMIEGSPYFTPDTEILIDIRDVNGNSIYYEPSDGIPEYYEGLSKVVSMHIYEDTPIGAGKITILAQLDKYIDANQNVIDIPAEWRGIYNYKWERNIKINPKLPNTDYVRFYRRPKVTIDEVAKSLYTNPVSVVTTNGTISGIPIFPRQGESFSNITIPTTYLLRITDDTVWSSSLYDNTIRFNPGGITASVIDIINSKDLVIGTPYVENNIVQPFDTGTYSIDYNTFGEFSPTVLTGSFAKIRISNLETFVGDVYRVKVFRKSQSDLSDWQFVQDLKLESNEILTDLDTNSKLQETYGIFTENILTTYWTGSVTSSFNSSYLIDSAKLISDSTNDVKNFYTINSLDLVPGTEYSLSFNVRKSGSINTGEYISAYITGSTNDVGTTQQIVKVPTQPIILQKTNITKNIILDDISNAKLSFDISGSDWYISDVSLRASQETSFSPDVVTFIQSVPRQLAGETFNYRFEFYDVNNNYIPVDVYGQKTFTGGNTIQNLKRLRLSSTSNLFIFDSGSNPVAPTTIKINATREYLTGSIIITSQSYGVMGNPIEPSTGLLINNGDDTYTLTVENFTGSQSTERIQYVQYNAVCEGVSDTITINSVLYGSGSRGIDGTDAKTVSLSANSYTVLYDRDNVRISPSQITLTATHQNQPNAYYFFRSSSNSGGSWSPYLQSSTTPTYTIESTKFPSSTQTHLWQVETRTSANTGTPVISSDTVNIFGVKQGSDAYTIFLTNETHAFPADENGVISAASLPLGATEARFFRGTTQYTYNQTGTGTTYKTGSITTSGLTISASVSAGVLKFTPTSVSANTGSAQITLIDNSNPSSAIFNKTYTFLVSRKGIDGVQGASGSDAKTVSLISNNYVITYDQNGILSPSGQVTVLTASQQNHSGNDIYYEFLENGVQKQNTTANTYTITPTDVYPGAGTSLLWEVKTRETGPTNAVIATDGIDIFGVKQGSDAYTIFLTNDSHVFPANSNGTVTSYQNSDTSIRVFRGATQYTYNQTGTGTTYKTGSIITSSGLTLSASVNSNQLKITPTSVTSLTGSFTVPVIVNDLNKQFDKTYSFSVTPRGIDGVDGSDGSGSYAVSLTSNNYVITYDQDGNLSPISQPTLLTASVSSGFSKPWFEFTVNNVVTQSYSAIATCSVIPLPGPGAVNLYRVNVKESGSNMSTQPLLAFDSIDIFGLRSGSNAYTVFLTNEAQTFPANSSGVVTATDLQQGFTEVRLFRGTTQYSYDQNGAIGSTTYKTGSTTATGIVMSGSILSNQLKYTPTSVTSDSGSFVVPIIDNSYPSSVIFNKTYTFNKSKALKPIVLVGVTPQAQIVLADATGSQTGILSDLTISAIDAGITRFTNYTASFLGFSESPVPVSSSLPTLGLSSRIISQSNTTASINILVRYADSEGTSLTQPITASLVKTRIGADGPNGSAGSSSYAVSLTSNNYAITYDQNGNLSPASQTTTLTATASLAFKTPQYQFMKGVSEVQPYSTTNTYTIAALPGPGVVELYQVNVREGTTPGVLAFDNIDIFGLKSGSDAYTVFLTNEATTYPASPSGVVQSSDLSFGTTDIGVYRGTAQYIYSQSSPYPSNSYRTGSVTAIGITMNGSRVSNQLRYTPATITSDSGSFRIPIIDNATGTTLTKLYTFNKSKAARNSISVVISPQQQTVTRELSNNTYSTPSVIQTIVTETGSVYSYSANANLGTNSTYTILNLVNGTNTAGIITASAVTNPTGSIVTFNVKYQDSSGFTSSLLPQSASISVVSNGQTGPGIVFTGVWTGSSNVTYQFGTDNPDGTNRRDVVLWSDNGQPPYKVYYGTLQQHTGSLGTSPSSSLGAQYWEKLGSGSLFVAAKIGLFEESYIQNTLNIGTSNNGGVSSANITLAGATTYPYFSLGQSNATASQIYGATGIFIGRDKIDGAYKASFVSGPNSLLWNGTNLIITGAINATSGRFAGDISAATGTFTGDMSAGTGTPMKLGPNAGGSGIAGLYLDTNNYWYTSSAFKVGNANNYMQWNNTSLVVKGIISASAGNFSGKVTMGTSGMAIGVDVNGTNDGLYINSNNYWYDTSAFKVGSTSNYLQWDNTNLNVIGVITATSGSIGGWKLGNSVISSSNAKIILDSNNSAIYLKDASGNNAVSIKSGSFTNVDTNLSFSGTSNYNSSTIYTSQGSLPANTLLTTTKFSFTPTSTGLYEIIVRTLPSVDLCVRLGTQLTFAPTVVYKFKITGSNIDQQIVQDSIGMPSGKNDYTFNAGSVSGRYVLNLTQGVTYNINRILEFQPNGSATAAVNIWDIPVTYSVNANTNNFVEINQDGIFISRAGTNYIKMLKSSNNTNTMLDVGGDISSTGDIIAFASSDVRLKKNIQKIDSPLDKITKISGNKYEWAEGYEDIHSNHGNDYGVIAQEIEKIFPEIVNTRNNGFKAVRYEKLIPVLIEAIKELNEKLNKII